MAKNAIYAQSGGVTAVINSTAAGVIETARKYIDKIDTMYAAQNGILGVLNNSITPLVVLLVLAAINLKQMKILLN